MFPPKVRKPESTKKPDKLKSTFMLQNNRSIRAQNDNIMKDKKILKSFSTIMETQEIGQLSVISEPGFSFASKDIIGELKEPEKSLWLVKSIIPTLIS